MIYISTADIPGKFITDKIEALVRVGVDCIELSGGSAYYDSDQVLKDLETLQRRHSLKFLLHNYFPPPEKDFVFNLSSDSNEIIEQSLSHAKKAIAFSRALGAKKIAFHSGFLVDAGTDELDKVFTKRRLLSKENAVATFLENAAKIESIFPDIKVYFENNVITQANLDTHDGENPFLLCSYSDYQELALKQEINILLDVAHLKISAQTLGKNFSSELEAFLNATNYIHFSQNNGIDDLNQLFSEDDPLWKTITNSNNHTITLEIKGDLQEIGQLYSKLQEQYDR